MLDQIVKKALPIVKSLYPGYELLLMFDNAISHSIYTKDTLQVAHMDKGPGGQQLFLWPGWYTNQKGELIRQDISTVTMDFVTGKSSTIQKEIQAILIEKGLLLQSEIWLVCKMVKCIICQSFGTSGICVCGQKCDLCKEAKS